RPGRPARGSPRGNWNTGIGSCWRPPGPELRGGVPRFAGKIRVLELLSLARRAGRERGTAIAIDEPSQFHPQAIRPSHLAIDIDQAVRCPHLLPSISGRLRFANLEVQTLGLIVTRQVALQELRQSQPRAVIVALHSG